MKQVLLAAKAKAEPLEAIAARASPEARRDAEVRLAEVSRGGKCWSVDDARAAAVGVMASGKRGGGDAAAR